MYLNSNNKTGLQSKINEAVKETEIKRESPEFHRGTDEGFCIHPEREGQTARIREQGKTKTRSSTSIFVLKFAVTTMTLQQLTFPWGSPSSRGCSRLYKCLLSEDM